MSNIIGLCLALLIDGSGSIPENIFNSMTEAHASVLETELIHRQASTDGLAIRVLVIENTPRSIIEWRVITSTQIIRNTAANIREISYKGGGTATAETIEVVLNEIENTPDINCERTIIDVATDGESNMALHVEDVRDRSEALGVTINAVTVQTDTGHSNPAVWARERLITSNGFVLESTNWNDWFLAIRRKMIMEITGIY